MASAHVAAAHPAALALVAVDLPAEGREVDPVLAARSDLRLGQTGWSMATKR